MARRSDLRGPFQRMPKWLLLAAYASLGFPICLVLGVVGGLRDGLMVFVNEGKELWNLED